MMGNDKKKKRGRGRYWSLGFVIPPHQHTLPVILAEEGEGGGREYLKKYHGLS
jgi:hypothetical protein